MNENLDPTDAHFSPEEQDIEKVLRPLSFDDFALFGKHPFVYQKMLGYWIFGFPNDFW